MMRFKKMQVDMIRVTAISNEQNNDDDVYASTYVDSHGKPQLEHEASVVTSSIKIQTEKGLRTLKMVSKPSANVSHKDSPKNYDKEYSTETLEQDLLFSRRVRKAKSLNKLTILVSALWFSLCAFIFTSQELEVSFISLGGYFSAVIAPLALLWLLLSNLQRQNDADFFASMLRRELNRIQPSSQTSASEINSDIERLAQQAEILNASSHAVMKSLNQTRHDLRSEIQNFVGVSKNAEFHIERLTEALTSRSAKLLDITKELDAQTLNLITASEDGVKKWDETAHKFSGHAEHIKTLFKDGINPDFFLEHLAKGAELIDEKVLSIQGVMQQLRQSSDQLLDRTEGIEQVSEDVSQRIEVIESRLKEQGINIHLLSDQAVLRSEAVEKAVSKQFESLRLEVDRALDALNNACVYFDNSTDGVGTAADSAIERITDACTHSELQSERLIRAAEKTAIKTQDMVSYMQGQTDSLVSGTSEALDILQKTGHTLSLRTKDITGQLDHILESSDKYSQKMKVHARELAQTAMSSAENMTEAEKILEQKLSDLKTIASSATHEMQQHTDKLDKEALRFISTSKDALGSAQGTTKEYALYTDQLIKSIEQAEEKAHAVQIKSLKAQDESFMNSARFIVESLYSLSVDLTRGLDGEISEKMWKAFNKGDVSIFARRFGALGDSVPKDKIADKYQNDSEFRSYVQRYKSQFEDIFQQALHLDHSHILATSFASSDVAKLYELLCDITGSGSRVSESRKVKTT